MTSPPRLVPVPPLTGRASRVEGSPFWIGASTDAGLPLFLPGIGARHAALLTRADGYWLVPQRDAPGAVRHNGRVVADRTRLADGDVIELLPGVAYRVELGGRRAPPVAPVAEPALAAAEPPLPPPARRSRWRAAWQRWRRRPRTRNAVRRKRWLVGTLGVVALALVAAAGVLLTRAVLRPTPAIPPPLSDVDAAEYDALAARVADHTERGAALLELGLPDAALREFGAAVTALTSSRLRENPWVRPRIDALEGAIATIYRERRVPVPARYADAARPAGPAGSRPALTRRARLGADEFAARLAQVRDAFVARFGRPLVVTGRDHAEHVALYGAGGAVDLRVRDLTRPQVAFVIERLRAAGVRVKDFSTDAVLQAQIAAATRAGLVDRAGTGLHLHADRFVDRRDRWTVE